MAMAQGFVHPEYLVDTGWLLVWMTRTCGGCFACSATSARWCSTADSRNGARKVGQSKADPLGRAKAHYDARGARREMVASKDDVLAAIGNADTCIINALRTEQHNSTGGVYYGRRGHIKAQRQHGDGG